MLHIGSSPRVWGLPAPRADGRGCPRFIPTCVGTTDPIGVFSFPDSVHPHVCGDYCFIFRTRSSASGSSPRVWGLRCPSCLGVSPGTVHPHVCGDYFPSIENRRPLTVHPHVCGDYGHDTFCGLIPSTVHPHVCGDYIGNILPHCVSLGSSPRVWGLRPGAPGVRRRVRFIPTCVGTTSPQSTRTFSVSVHPHVCGDYVDLVGARDTVLGSSPRVWGLLRYTVISLGIPRFIPTCVGTTDDEGPDPAHLSVHPHVCGDYRASAPPARAFHGSSPRVWGLRLSPVARGLPPRFIPTCVGTTTSCTGTAGAVPVHPHVCGDYVWAGGAVRAWGSVHPHVCGDYLNTQPQAGSPGRFIPTCVGTTRAVMRSLPVMRGSSPRVWGLPARRRASSRRRRFIPTCVGTT